MGELPELARWVLVGFGVFILFAFAWVATRPMPKLARALARLCLLALVVFPIALLVLGGHLGMPEMASRAPQREEPATGGPDRDLRPQKAAKPTVAPSVEPEPEIVAEAEPEVVGEAAPEAEAPAVEVGEAAPEEPVVEAAPDPAGGSGPPEEKAASEGEPPSRGLGGADGTATSPPPPPPPAPAPVPAPVAEAEKKDGYDIVPVYFGTDRAEASTEKRLDYGANRGRKLTLGQALVTVPKSHVQPTIERPWAIRIPYFDITLYEEDEDPAKHFTMKELKAATREEFLALVRARLAKSERYKDHALVFVHGYNTTFDNGVYRTAQIAYDLKFDGAPFLYSWPSGGGLASYTYDRESAGQAVPYMREFLDLVIKETGAKTVSVIAHSMGNQPTLQVLKDIKASSPPGIVISQIILAAPDVDRDNFENIAKEIQGLANGITLYAAANDRALSASRRFHGGVPRAGDVPEGGPIVLPGVDTIDVTAVSTDSFGLNHSGYAENNALLNDLQLLIQTGERPPEKRVPLLEKIGTSLGDYWRYPVTP